MGYTFDYFVGQMVCLHCGVVSSADESTDMQTKICAERELRRYGVGDFLPADYDNMRNNRYVEIVPPSNKKNYSVLDWWNCVSCEASLNWARIIVEEEIIRSIASVSLDKQIIESSNYICEDYVIFGWQVTNGRATRSAD